MTQFTVLGGGAMGTACAVLLADHADQQVTLWARNPQYAQHMHESRENTRLLPGVAIPEAVRITADAEAAVAAGEVMVIAVPTRYLRASLTGIADLLGPGVPVVSVIKGIENDTLLRPSEIIREMTGERPVVALSGPSHAEEIATGLPASVVAASEDVELAEHVQQAFSTPRFRVYTNSDLLGVELAGALKNVIALAAGIGDGLGYGDNAKAALLTRGIVEMMRFGHAMGADRETFSGLAGVGDLITTCVSPHGRNRQFGERLGKGETFDEIRQSMTAEAEGVNTTRSVHDIARNKGIEMPITAEVYRVLFEDKSAVEATDSLMMRPPRDE